MATTAGAVDASTILPAVLRPLINTLGSRRRIWIGIVTVVLAIAAARSYNDADAPGVATSGASAGRGEFEAVLRDDDVWSSFPPLEELEERDRLWPPDLGTFPFPSLGGVMVQTSTTCFFRCRADLSPLSACREAHLHAQDLRTHSSTCCPRARAKVRQIDCSSQVYDLPPHLQLPDETVSQCRWSAYNSELLLHKLLVEPPSISPASPSHPHLSLFTSDPSEADFFFVPLFPACYLFNCWVKAGWKTRERCDVDEAYIQPVMRHVRQAFPHWNVSGGADHLLVHPMDHVDGYYTEESRVAMNASTYLVTVGDVRPAPYGKEFRFHRDLVIPSSTHLLNSYFVNPMDYLDEDGRPLSVLRGAQRLNRQVDLPPTGPEIFLPSPEPPLRRSLLSLRASLRRWFPSPLAVERRTTLAIFRGGVGKPSDGESYALRIRSLFFPSSGNSSLPPFSSHSHPGFSSLPGFDIAEWSENVDYARRLSRSKFGLAPPGYTLDTTRLYEYLAFGIVPVFIGTGPTAGQVLPFSQDVDWSSFTVSIPRERAHETPRILREMSEAEYERKRRKVWEVGRKVVLEGREGNVWKLLARQLCRVKRIGLTPGAEIANN
jgi:hypothetical protein